MRVDRAVSRRKFEREVERVKTQQDLLVRWGCFVVRAEYPSVDVVFVPRRPAVVALPAVVAQGGGQNALVRGIGAEVPGMAARAFGARLGLDDFDIRAPSVAFMDPWTWKPLPFGAFPVGHIRLANGQTQPVIVQSHPETKLPFLCIPGTREYHEHPQHDGDDWMLHRPEVSLFSTLAAVWKTCVGPMRPASFAVAVSSGQQPGVLALTNWDHVEGN